MNQSLTPSAARSTRESFRRLGLLGFLYVATALPLVAQESLELHFIANTDTLSLCEGEDPELTVEVWMSNPAGLEVGGFQVIYAFPAEYLVLDRFETRDLEGVVTNGPPDFGVGFPTCDQVGPDLWDDGLGRDVLSMVASVSDEDARATLRGESVSLGAFIFRVAESAPLGTVTLTFPLETCPPAIRAPYSFFDLGGQPLETNLGAGDLSLTLERLPVVSSLSCTHSTETGMATLSWEFPEGIDPDGVRITRDGEVIAAFVPGFLGEFEDDLPVLCGRVEYGVSLQVGGLEVPCAVTCTLEGTGVENFVCQRDAETDEYVLNWDLPADTEVESLRLYRDGELLTEDLNPLITTFREPAGDPCASVTYELAIVSGGEESPCRTACDFGDGLAARDFVRGDVNFSGNQDISDAIISLNFQFLGDPVLTCPDAADSDDDGALTVTDAIRILQFLFLGGQDFPPPAEVAGSDPTADDLCCY